MENNFAADIAAINERIDGTVEDIARLDKRVTKHGEEIDNLGKAHGELKMQLELINKDLQIIAANTTDTKDDVRTLMKQKIEMHYIDPLKKKDAAVEKGGWIVLTIVITFIVYALFPHLRP